MRRIPRTYVRSRRSQKRRNVARIVLAILALIVLWYVFGFIKGLFSFESSQVQSMTLATPNASQVEVELEPGTWNSGVTDIKLYADNRVRTNNAQATLTTHDQSSIMLDRNSEILIVSSQSSDTLSEWSVQLVTGRIIVVSGDDTQASRSVVHPQATVVLPQSSTAYISQTTFANLKDASAGISIVPLEGEEFLLGEGQQYTIPEGGIFATAEQNYAVRTSLTAEITGDEFVASVTNLGSPTETPDDSALLIVTAPSGSTTTDSTSYEVTGTVQSSVNSVEVNGEEAELDNGTFVASISLDEGENEVEVVAYDEAGDEVASITRTITQNVQSLATPRITAPGTNGSTYQTSEDVVIISGTTSANTDSIMVNDYTLQLYEAGSTEWRYLAQTELGNLTVGTNEFTVIAKTANGTQSEAATITIQKTAGTSTSTSSNQTSTSSSSVSSTSSVTTSSTSSSTSDSGEYSLSIVRPTSNGTLSTTEPEILIEGLNSTNVQNVIVNGYTLQLFEPAKGFWNYKASSELGTMQAGENLYTVQATNSNGDVVETVTYTITYTPAAEPDQGAE